MTRLTRQCSGDIRRRLQRLGTRHRFASTPHASACLLALTLALTAVVTLAVPAPVAAQEARGTITGTIQDSSGGVIPGATVTIVNKERGTTVTIITNEVGFFQAPYLIPGVYIVNAELQGFRKAAREVEVRIADRLEINLTLAAGETVESVTVTADTPLLETTNASLGNVVDSRRISQLPTPHGDPYALIGLATGVTYTGSARLDRPFEPTHIVGYAMDGTRGNRSDLTIDGVPSTATANAGEVIASYVPPADIVQEFKVQTATFDASTGNTEGGVTNLVIKSGTNRLRGTVYLGKTPGDLFANDFFANANNIPLADFSYNRYGGTAGGPMILPGYDGRNRTFFMYGFEGIHESRPRNNGTPTVPTERMRTGDFSELLALGSQYQIYNPFTRRAIGGGRFQQDPFPGNIIPPNLINPVARAALEYFGRPLTAGGTDGTSNFQQPSLPEDIKYANNTVRIDHNLTDKQRMYGRFSWYDRNSNYNNYFNNLATGEWFKFVSRQFALDHVYVMTPSTVVNFRYGYNWFVRGTNSNPANRGFDLTSLGFPASYNSAIPQDIRRFPRFDIAGYQGTGVGGEERPNETHSFIGTVNKSMGAHSLKTGMEVRQYRETSEFFANNQTGQFNFDSTWTRGPLDNSANAPGQLGQSFASFLLGLPSSGFVARAAAYDEKSQNWGFFVQDDWRLSSALTVNLGLRYEYEVPLSEVDNKSVRGFDAAVVQSIEAAARARYALNPTPEVPVSAFNVRGGLLFAGVDGQPSGLYESPKSNFMPRVGLTYKLNDLTVVRGGYGMFYGFLGQRRGDVIQSGFSQNTNIIPSLDNGLTFIATLSNPFPNGITEPVGNALGVQTFLGQGISYFDPNPKSPRSQRWQIGVQRELPGRVVVELGYVGNYGSQLQTSRNINATPLQFLSTSPVRDQTTINYLGQNIPNPFFGLLPSTSVAALQGTSIARERLLRPYPQFDAVNTSTNEGYSWYHSMQINLQRRLANGYTIAAAYTYSKFTEATEFLNAADPEPWEGISSVDTPHRISANGIVELPFGRGKRFGADSNGVVSVLISGWQFSGIYTYQSGFPLTWGNILFTGNVDDIDLASSERTVARWFNTDAGFNKVAGQQLASNVRTFPLRLENVRGDAINNVDLSLIKNTQIAGKTLEIRFDSLNALNHPYFAVLANTNPTAAAFGTVTSSTQVNYARRSQVSVKFLF
jgi:Carboxypeptidase regulatory-like domain/TonB dependent receptor